MSNHVAGTPEWVTKDYLTTVLRNSIKDDAADVDDFEASPASAVGDNYVCQILRIKLDYTRNGKKETLWLISKIVPSTDISKELSKDYDLFSTEIVMSSKTLPELYDKFKDKIDRFFPKLYYMDDQHQVMHMEDLGQAGFQMSRQNRSLDLKHTLLVMKALASLHASSYLLLKEKPEVKDMYLDYFWKKSENSFIERLINSVVKYLLEFIPDWPISEEHRKKLRSLKSSLYPRGVRAYTRREESVNVLLHGDCWVNNMLFRYDEDEVAEVKLIDFQLTNYNSIGLDLNYFIFTSAGQEVRTKHIDKLLETYHRTFLEIAGNVPGFDLGAVKKEFHERLDFGLVCQIAFRPGMLGHFDLDAVLKGEESEANRSMYQNPVYIEETIAMLPLLERHGVL